jgi:hypothetical protein
MFVKGPKDFCAKVDCGTSEHIPNKMTARETLTFHRKNYKPLHQDIFVFSEKFVVPSFLEVVQDAKELAPLMKSALDGDEQKQIEFNEKRRNVLVKVLQAELKDVYSLEIFTQEFSNKLIEEVKNYEKTQDVSLRPNSMNSYGLVIDELGMGPFFDVFVKDYFSPFAKIMNKGAYELDDHHTFIVEYFIGGDTNLSIHVDDSELTINLCLGVEGFTGGEVFFRGHRDKPTTYNDYGEYENVVGRAIVHDGRHMHGACTLKSGERYNLIIWCRSTKYRQAECEHVHDENCQHEHVHDEHCDHHQEHCHHEHVHDEHCDHHQEHEHVHDENCKH